MGVVASLVISGSATDTTASPFNSTMTTSRLICRASGKHAHQGAVGRQLLIVPQDYSWDAQWQKNQASRTSYRETVVLNRNSNMWGSANDCEAMSTKCRFSDL